MDPEKTTSAEKGTRIRHGTVDSVDIFHVKENELDLLEKGSPAELNLNFAIALLSLAFSSLTTLLTSTFNKPIFQVIFVVVTIVGVVLGLYFFISWRRERKSIVEVIKTIRSRIPSEPSPPQDTRPIVPPGPTDPTAPKG